MVLLHEFARLLHADARIVLVVFGKGHDLATHDAAASIPLVDRHRDARSLVLAIGGVNSGRRFNEPDPQIIGRSANARQERRYAETRRGGGGALQYRLT